MLRPGESLTHGRPARTLILLGLLAVPAALGADLLGTRLFRPSGGTERLHLHPQGQWILAEGWDQWSRWARSGAPLGTWRYDCNGWGVMGSDLSANGGTVAIVCEETGLVFVDPLSGRRTGGVRLAPDYPGTVLWAPEGRRLVAQVEEGLALVEGSSVTRVLELPARAEHFAWVDSNHLVAAWRGSVDGSGDTGSGSTVQVDLVDVRTGQRRLMASRESGEGQSLCASPDGELVAWVDWDGIEVLRVSDASTVLRQEVDASWIRLGERGTVVVGLWQEVRVLDAQGELRFTLPGSQDQADVQGHWLAMTRMGALELVDLRTGQPTHQELGLYGEAAVLDGVGPHTLSVDDAGRAVLWGGREPVVLAEDAQGGALSPEGDLAVLLHEEAVSVWSTRKGQERARHDLPEEWYGWMVATDGQRALVGGDRLWSLDLGSGEATTVPAHMGEPEGLRLAAGGELALAWTEHRLHVLDPAGRDLRELQLPWRQELMSASLGPDGQLVLVVYDDDRGTVVMVPGQEPAWAADAWIAALSQDGTLVALTDEDSPIQVRSAADGAVLRSLRPSSQVELLAFSQDGRTLLAGLSDTRVERFDLGGLQGRAPQRAVDNELALVDLEAMEELTPQTRVTEPVRRLPTTGLGELLPSPDGQRLAAAGSYGQLLQVHPQTGRVTQAKQVSLSMGRVGLAWGPKGQRMLVAGEEQAKVVDLDTWERSELGTSSGQWARWAGDVLAVSDGSEATLYDAGGARLGSVQSCSWAQGVALTETALASACSKGVIVAPVDGSTVWEPGLHTGGAVAVAWSADGHLLATAGKEGTLALWRWPQRERLATRQGVLDVTDLAFSPDGDRLAVSRSRADVVLWDTRELLPHAEVAGTVRARVSWDGELLLTQRHGEAAWWEVPR